MVFIIFVGFICCLFRAFFRISRKLTYIYITIYHGLCSLYVLRHHRHIAIYSPNSQEVLSAIPIISSAIETARFDPQSQRLLIGCHNRDVMIVNFQLPNDAAPTPTAATAPPRLAG
jgi:hypothetical protein